MTGVVFGSFVSTSKTFLRIRTHFYTSVSAVFLRDQNLWQPLPAPYIKPNAINMYIVVHSISTKNKRSFKKMLCLPLQD